jgi:hypothetical protein
MLSVITNQFKSASNLLLQDIHKIKLFSIVTTFFFVIVCFKTVKGQLGPHLSNLKGLIIDFGNTIKDAFTGRVVSPITDAEKRAVALSVVRYQLGMLSSV